MIVHRYIKREKFNQFHELLVFYDGAYVRNTVMYDTLVMVNYTFDDMDDANAFHIEFERMCRPIKEKHRPKWRQLLARIMYNFGKRKSL